MPKARNERREKTPENSHPPTRSREQGDSAVANSEMIYHNTHHGCLPGEGILEGGEASKPFATSKLDSPSDICLLDIRRVDDLSNAGVPPRPLRSSKTKRGRERPRAESPLTQPAHGRALLLLATALRPHRQL